MATRNFGRIYIDAIAGCCARDAKGLALLARLPFAGQKAKRAASPEQPGVVWLD